jgi:hypothetical protein
MYVMCMDPIEDSESDFMDEILSRPMFSGLESVTVHVHWVRDRSAGLSACSWFKQKLPLCEARGILSVLPPFD